MPELSGEVFNIRVESGDIEMKIAIPIAKRLGSHFDHCKAFALIEVLVGTPTSATIEPSRMKVHVLPREAV